MCDQFQINVGEIKVKLTKERGAVQFKGYSHRRK